MSAATFWWNAIGLFLVLVFILQRPRWGWMGLLLAAFAAMVLSVTPFFGHPPRFWLSGLTPNVSVTLIALLSAGLLERVGGCAIFRRREWSAAWIFGAISALVLYPSALGLGLPWFDSYALGWPWLEWKLSGAFFVVLALAAGLLAWCGNRFAWVLAACAAAYQLGVQESRNFWDYLVDPLYAAVSLVAVTRAAVLRLLRR